MTDVLWGEDTDLLGHAGSETPAFLKRFFAFSKYNAMKSFIPNCRSHGKIHRPSELVKAEEGLPRYGRHRKRGVGKVERERSEDAR